MRNPFFSLILLFAFVNMQAQTTQTIALQQGWNIFSSYLNPTNPNMFDIVEDLINNDLFVIRMWNFSLSNSENPRNLACLKSFQNI